MDKDVEQKVKHAFFHATPDVLDNILADCNRGKETMTMTTNEKKTKKWIALALASAATVAVISVSGYSFYSSNYAVETTVLLDVNPSIALEANSKDEVVSTNALNTDANMILDEMDLNGTDVTIAVNAILGAMLREGYITQEANSVLLSVNSENAAHATELQNSLSQGIADTLGQGGVQASVLSQTIQNTTSPETQPETNDVSAGKAQLIEQLIAQNPAYTFDQLAALSVNDLNLLADAATGLTIEGKASDTGYIGSEAALSAALAHAGVAPGTEVLTEIDLDYENGQMVYEVEFEAGGNEYSYDIASDTGAVVASNFEPQEGQQVADDVDDVYDDLDDMYDDDADDTYDDLDDMYDDDADDVYDDLDDLYDDDADDMYDDDTDDIYDDMDDAYDDDADDVDDD